MKLLMKNINEAIPLSILIKYLLSLLWLSIT